MTGFPTDAESHGSVDAISVVMPGLVPGIHDFVADIG
jgi:hypothetical protein